jgi:hypothetical protein
MDGCGRLAPLCLFSLKSHIQRSPKRFTFQKWLIDNFVEFCKITDVTESFLRNLVFILVQIGVLGWPGSVLQCFLIDFEVFIVYLSLSVAMMVLAGHLFASNS